ncbi:MAG: hypothetical protein KQH79_12845 [Bacteroidetes bacterium]|nr:hypothetical protein [Bacteroidota bacterium]
MRFFIVLFMVIISFSTCKQEKLVNELKSKSDFIEGKWKFKEVFPGNYEITQTKGSEYSKVAFTKNDILGVALTYHFKKTRISDEKYRVKYFSFSDTLCVFDEMKNGERTFFKGKYYYYYVILRLNKEFTPTRGQIDYYYNFQDSLINIRGNDLPDLPELKKSETRVEYEEEEIVENE